MTTPTPGSIVPCLWFDDQAEAAAAFYTDTFPDGRITGRSYYSTLNDNPAGKPRGSLLTVEFEIGGMAFTALNGGPIFTITPVVSFFFQADTAAEVDRLYARLVEGGKPLMDLGTYPWSERYAWVQDRFGVSWQLMAGPRFTGKARIAPCLMFTGKRHGRAEEALNRYARVLHDARIESIARYAPGEGPENTVKHGRLVVGDQTLVAMDSHVSPDLAFNEAVSLQLMCKDQAEVDEYWETLAAEGGEHQPCGWLKDKFGVSWQVVPAVLGEWLNSTDQVARDRAFDAVMKMGKLDIAAIERAFKGVG
ncbi:MAG: VOC family protein [Pseudomonadota bacterium]